MKVILSLALLLFALANPLARAATFTWDAQRGNDQTADFRLWMPDGVLSFRAVIAVIPGRNGDSRASVDDPVWQACARRNGSALLGCKLLGPDYFLANYWSGAVFLQALVELGRQSSHSELATVPIALWGHSAGAQWSCSLAFQHPERVMVFVANRGSDDYWQLHPALCHIPALWIAGEKDENPAIIGHMADAYSSGRRMGAPWAFAVAPGATHAAGNSKEFGIAFLDAIFRLRSGGAAYASPATTHWTGSLSTHDIARASSPDAGTSLDAWLPDETFAHLWHTFVTTPTPSAASPSPAVAAGASPASP